jgi:hypothetical protein
MKYVGIDLHTNRFTCCYLGDNSREKQIETFDLDNKGLCRFFSTVDKDTYERTMGSLLCGGCIFWNEARLQAGFACVLEISRAAKKCQALQKDGYRGFPASGAPEGRISVSD